MSRNFPMSGYANLPNMSPNSATDPGVDYMYDENGGGHVFNASKSLQFLSDHLSDQPPEPDDTELISVEPRGKYTTTWAATKYQ